MTEPSDADLTALGQATVALVEALDGITEREASLPTPCQEWNLAELVDHVTGGNWFTIHVLSGKTADGAMAATMDRFAGGSTSHSDAIRSATDQLDAIREPGVLDGIWHHVAGDLSGRQLLRLRLHDVIVHTWDINQTRRPPASVPTELAQWGLDELRGDESLMANHFGIPEPAGARRGTDDPSSQYLRAAGRQPSVGQAEPGR